MSCIFQHYFHLATKKREIAKGEGVLSKWQISLAICNIQHFQKLIIIEVHGWNGLPAVRTRAVCYFVLT